MSLDERFNAAVEGVNKLPTQPSNEDALELYSLFKQATVGDVNTKRPGMTDFKGKAKWDAWSGRKGLSSESAKEQYIAKAAALGIKV